MVRRRISEAQRWQIIGMRSSGLSYKAIGRQMGYHYTVVSRLVRKHIQTNNVKDLPRFGRPLVTSQREDRALQRLIRRMPFATSPNLKREWLPYRQLSTRTLRNRLKSAGLKSRRSLKIGQIARFKDASSETALTKSMLISAEPSFNTSDKM
ncbi:unnamed protein product [Mytilus coruscus]|uniref:Transposase IS30-like HTH domain-containing protein n=1 Tax=Mytilus coruscus TaxID=42192 RepID=A0A6J8C9K9_MYTCO|nr:unnamed protein product [Mytilus coruscus]